MTVFDEIFRLIDVILAVKCSSHSPKYFVSLRGYNVNYMDIDLLSKMVKELILDNDRVVLPGLGSFVAEIVPSTFSDKGYTINPPYRRLYFRSKPDQGDELIKFYAKSNSVQMEMADRIITDFVAELKSVLHTKKTVVFPGLGRLRATKENNVFFVADEDLDIYPDGFGLEPISLKTNQETVEEVSAAVSGLKSLLHEAAPEKTVETPVETVVEPAVESIVEPEPAIAPVPAIEPEPVAEPEPVVVPEPVAEPEPVEVAEPESVTETAVAVAKKPKRRVWKKVMWAIIILLIVAAVLFGAFFAVSRICPELLDNILYSKEELEILNYKL